MTYETDNMTCVEGICHEDGHQIKECKHGSSFYCPECGFMAEVKKAEKTSRCPTCNGRGTDFKTGIPCGRCQGSGEVKE